ncbi:hypothetical protein ACJVC5_07815 [Peredibacter sp. HCB2-198]|uniref:hypothetical protein n=1 Tax=Peredibacter sp. HCB2-198 TaxID=3383025 RepID=UPI0038B558F9
MQSLGQKNNELTMKLDTEELTSTQVRLIKSVHALLAHVLASEEEGEYFDASAELMRKTAELIKHANFAVDHKEMAYGDQAVEFAVDFLTESMDEQNLNNIDN